MSPSSTVKATCVIFQTAFECLHTIRAHLFHCGGFIRLSALTKLTLKVNVFDNYKHSTISILENMDFWPRIYHILYLSKDY